MNLKSLVLTFGAAFAAFLVVGIAVTELVSARIEFSVFVGVPAGLIAGAIVGGLVASGSADGGSAQRRRFAESVAGFGLASLAVLIVGSLADLGITLTILAGVVVGVLAGVTRYLRGGRPAAPGATL